MNVKKSWLDVLKKTIEEGPRPSHEDSRKPASTTVQNVRKPREVSRGDVVDLDAARAARDGDGRRLIAAGLTPKDGCGPLNPTIWADPETGFYCSRDVALHRSDRGAGGGA